MNTPLMPKNIQRMQIFFSQNLLILNLKNLINKKELEKLN
jgi:hypothetical protein